jgi:hypothetical protein
MRLQNPITDVYDVDVLLHDDVTRKRAIVNPVAQAQLDWRSARTRRTFEIASQIVSFAAHDSSKRAVMDAIDQFDERRTIPNLEADIKT